VKSCKISAKSFCKKGIKKNICKISFPKLIFWWNLAKFWQKMLHKKYSKLLYDKISRNTKSVSQNCAKFLQNHFPKLNFYFIQFRISWNHKKNISWPPYSKQTLACLARASAQNKLKHALQVCRTKLGALC